MFKIPDTGAAKRIRYHCAMSSKANARTFTIVVLIASAAYFAFVCLYLSAHRMMWADEFDAWNILADPSWRHAFESLNNGADSGPPFYYAIGRCLLAVAGLHPVVMRLYSAVCFWLAAVILVQILRRYFTGLIAVFAVVVAFACNPEVVDQAAQIRFYGEMVLAVSVGVRIALWLEEKRPAVWLWFGANFLAGLFLVASHPLGLIYSAVIAFAQLCTKAPARMRVAAVAGTVLSWAYLLVFFQPLKHAAQTGYWLHAPNAADVVHFYDNHPLLFAHYRYVSVVLNLLLLCLAVYGCFWFVRNRKWEGTQPNGLSLLFYISVLLLLMPVSFAIVSHLYKPIFLGRYLLPYYLGLSALAAAGAWVLTQRFQVRSLSRFAVPVSVALVVFAFATFTEARRDPLSDLDPVLQLSQSMPTVMQDDGIVRQAHFYAPDQAKNLFYLMLLPKPGDYATLYSIAEQGYEPALVFDEPFFSQHRQFLYIDGPWQPMVFNADLRGNPRWISENAGAVTIRGVTYPVLKFTRVDDSAPTAISSR
jgi:hypothetical protein